MYGCVGAGDLVLSPKLTECTHDSNNLCAEIQPKNIGSASATQAPIEKYNTHMHIYMCLALLAHTYLKPATLLRLPERSHLRERARALAWPAPARAHVAQKDRSISPCVSRETLSRIDGKRVSHLTPRLTHMICIHACTGQDHNCICSALLALDCCCCCAEEQRRPL